MAGTVTVTATPAAAKLYNRNVSFVGAVPVVANVAAALTYSRHHVISGTATVTVAVASGMAMVIPGTINGSVTVTTAVSSTLLYQRAKLINGSVRVLVGVHAFIERESAVPWNRVNWVGYENRRTLVFPQPIRWVLRDDRLNRPLPDPRSTLVPVGSHTGDILP